MARLDGGRFNRWVEKLFNIKQAGASITGVEDSLRPVVMMQNGNEERYLQGWQRFMFTTTAAAGAAVNTSIQIRNPANSSIVMVFEKINALPGATELCQMFISPGGGDNSGLITLTTIRIDKRTAPTSIAVCSQGTALAIPGAGTAPSFRMLATTTGNTEFISTVNQEITLMPNDVLVVIGELVNTQLSVAFQWRERVLESSELT